MRRKSIQISPWFIFRKLGILKLKEIFHRFLNRLTFFMPGGYRIRPLLHKIRGVRIGKQVFISKFVYLDELHPEAISIGDNSSIGLRSSVFTHFYWGGKRSKEHAGPVIIEEDVFIGPHCVILPNVTIGRGSVIQAGTVVTRNVPPGIFWGAPKAGPLAKATIPLTHENEYDMFVRGLRPMK